MQTTGNFAQNNAERRGSRDHVNHRMAQLSKLFGLRTATLLPAILICLMMLMGRGTSVAQTMSNPTNAAAPSDAQKAYDKMKTLAGAWQGTVMGMSLNITIRLASSGTAILSEGTGDGKRPPDHEITMFYVEGDRLLATHYCDAGNRSRMEGKVSPDADAVEFNTVDVAGGTQRGFTKRMVFTIIDANKYIGELTYILPDGKAVEARGEFQRLK
jgi:hypothetical protein